MLQYLNKSVNVVHEGLCSTNDELVYTGNSMRPTEPQDQPLDTHYMKFCSQRDKETSRLT